MHRLLNGGRPAANMNKPLPEPLVDPDEGKTPIGELVIIPIQGKDLPNRERFGKQDPFILFKLGNVSKRSSTDVRGGQRPIWKDDQINIFMYESDAKDAKSLYVTCLDEDPKKNDLIGDCVINLAKVLEQGEHDDWFELSYKGREAGMLMLQLTYYSHDPVVPAQVPMVSAAGYPYGTLPAGAGRPVSPSGQNHYVGHHTPVVPPVNPYGQPAAPANPYAANNAYPGYPTAAAPGYADPNLGADPSKRLSFTGQPPAQPGGFPAAGYPANQGYPAQVPGQQTGFPPQTGGFPPQVNNAFPAPGGGYPPATAVPNTPFPAAHPLPGSQGGGGPPAGYPFAASNIYPPNTSNSGINTSGPGFPGQTPPQGFPQGGPGFPGPANNSGNGNNASFNGGFPGNNNNNNNNIGPYNNAGGINNHSNGNVNNMNQNNFNNGSGFNNNNNNNAGGFNNNGNNGFNGGNNNFNGGNNFNNGGGFNQNNNNNNVGGNFNNNGGNFNNSNNNNNGGNFNNHGNNGSGFNNNNNNNSNNGSSFGSNSNGSSHNSGGHNHSYSNSGNPGAYPVATPKKHNTISPTPIVATPVTPNRTVGGSMYGPDEF
ncbi:hypothetical protein BGZ70_003742 [Mortierella alpina]|uniref:C2 domain-containing protein n=1 Tax=Mortierella alpina TaxID=64518 RepID=A0A9P6IS02_MORAP|nr:hypothetical protein BGZ70_003742 [Mortierella alpina]